MKIFGLNLGGNREQSSASAQQQRKFRRVSPTLHIAEHRGVLPSTPWAEHQLWCTRIEPEQGRALVRQGYAPLGAGLIPSHSIFCVARVAGKSGQTRYCFGLYFALGWTAGGRVVPAGDFMDATAERLTAKLAQSLQKSTLPSFTLRCLSEIEYPWCLSGEAFDEYWQIEAGVWYRQLTKLNS